MPVRTDVLMRRIVTIEVVCGDSEEAIDRAFGWFREIEARCSRFEEHSELRQLSMRVGVPVPASPILFEAVRFALQVAEETGGVFDPTVGLQMESRGFDREYRGGRRDRTSLPLEEHVTYRDVEIDADERTITLHKPLLLDLGSVAKGLAVDAAARELQPFRISRSMPAAISTSVDATQEASRGPSGFATLELTAR